MEQPKLPHTILFVDDEDSNLHIFKIYFRNDYTVLTANNGEQALALLAQREVAVLLADQRMPGMTGVDLLHAVRQRFPHTVRVLVTGFVDMDAIISAINTGEIYRYIQKPWNYAQLRDTLRACAETYVLEQRNRNLVEDLRSLFMSSIAALVQAIDARDHYTCGHSQRVAEIATQLARDAGLSPAEVEQIHLAALLHDIGKIGVPEAVLNKPGALTAEEWDKIREHSITSETILRSISQLDHIRLMIRHHHERFDGGGYPDHLAGEQIPYASRIIALADTYDALTTDRPYRQALSPGQAAVEIRKNLNSQFDPQLGTLFLTTTLGAVEKSLIGKGNEA